MTEHDSDISQRLLSTVEGHRTSKKRSERMSSRLEEAEEAEVQKHCGGHMAPAKSGQRLCGGHIASGT